MTVEQVSKATGIQKVMEVENPPRAGAVEKDSLRREKERERGRSKGSSRRSAHGW